MLMQEVACFQSLQSRRFEAQRGLGEAWTRPGEATPRTQNVLAQDKARLIGTRNYIILLLKSSKAELEVVGACAALLEF